MGTFTRANTELAVDVDGSGQQHRAEAFFEPRDRLRDGRLRHAEELSGFGERTELRDAREDGPGFEIRKVLHGRAEWQGSEVDTAAQHAAGAMRLILIRPGRIIVMESYLLSLSAGVLVGVVYSVIKVRSPAPPLIALIGLAGMLIGSQAIGAIRHWLGF